MPRLSPLRSLSPAYSCRAYIPKSFRCYVTAPQSRPDPLRVLSTPAVARGTLVYSALSIPGFTEASPHLLRLANSIPGLRQLSHAFIRETFFKHFVGGDHLDDTIPLIQDLRRQGLGTLLGYSVEMEPGDAGAKPTLEQMQRLAANNVTEMLRSIDVATQIEDRSGRSQSHERKTWVAVKLSALLPDPYALVRVSQKLVEYQGPYGVVYDIEGLIRDKETAKKAGISATDYRHLRALLEDVYRVGDFAVKGGIRLILDAEYTSILPATDAFTIAMARRCNSPEVGPSIRPVIYQTFQAYLRSTQQRLHVTLDHALANNYSLGVKLVRGAYHGHEMAAYDNEDKSTNKAPAPPVWTIKSETDANYNRCARILVDRISDQAVTPCFGIMFATHNRKSCDLVLEAMIEKGLVKPNGDQLDVSPHVGNQIQFAQLYAMADELTYYLVDRLNCPEGPLVTKYLPYGPLEDVIPYLSRRAVENAGVVGDAVSSRNERQRFARELRERLFHA